MKIYKYDISVYRISATIKSAENDPVKIFIEKRGENK
jgi:hypothetical protein